MNDEVMQELYRLYGALNVVHSMMPDLNLMPEWQKLLETKGVTHKEYINYSRKRNGMEPLT